MIYILLFMLLNLTFICYIVADRDFVSPCVIVPSTFSFCTALAALYTIKWNLPMHADTCLVIVAMIAFFEMGTLLALWSFRGHRLLEPITTFKGFVLPFKYLTPLIMVMILFLFFNYQELWEISRPFTTSMQLNSMIEATVYHMEIGDARGFSRWYTYRFIFAQGAALVSGFAFLYNMIYKFKSLLYNLRFTLPICIYLGFIVMTGGRQSTVYIAIFMLVIGSLLYVRKQKYSKWAYKRVILLCMATFLAFFSVFYALGTLSGKVNETRTALGILAHYAGTNISAFDYFLHSLPIPESDYIGTMTLVDIYSKLGKLSTDIPQAQGYIRDFAKFDGIDTNVYTALRRYIQDYGFVGCAVIMFILGVFYQGLYNTLKYSRKLNCFLLIAYAFLCYPYFLMCREERFMLEILSSRTVYVLVCMFVLYRILLCIQKKYGTFIEDEHTDDRIRQGVL